MDNFEIIESSCMRDNDCNCIHDCKCARMKTQVIREILRKNKLVDIRRCISKNKTAFKVFEKYTIGTIETESINGKIIRSMWYKNLFGILYCWPLPDDDDDSESDSVLSFRSLIENL